MILFSLSQKEVALNTEHVNGIEVGIALVIERETHAKINSQVGMQNGLYAGKYIYIISGFEEWRLNGYRFDSILNNRCFTIGFAFELHVYIDIRLVVVVIVCRIQQVAER